LTTVQQPQTVRVAFTPLQAVKLAHTIAWAFFVACIAAIPVMSWRGEHRIALWFAAIVFAEVVILVVNGWRCPLTSVAARYTDDREPNFDIYLPRWLAEHNKLIFGILYFIGLVFALVRWAGHSSA
jgi:polyferredoxin